VIGAAIFDFDGTLVDTMPIHFEAYRRAFAKGGVDLAPDDFYPHIGGRARETIPRFLRGRPCSLDVDAVHREKKSALDDLLRTAELKVLDTAVVLESFVGLVPVALASSGSRPGIETMLARLGWTRWFNAIVTGEDAERGKPAPDLFLLAAQRLRVDAASCVVFEDTDDGVAAAVAAGMKVFDVRRAAAPSRGAR
jgi:beta-phosphoglucomutase-like phosphatase (HAD superfamily)